MYVIPSSNRAGRNKQPNPTSWKKNGGNHNAEALNARLCDMFLLMPSQRRWKDKKDRGTVENVLDSRTRFILYKMIRAGYLEAVHGCISTGKEANVYYSFLCDGSPAAIKIYRTSILLFKDRERYIQGDFRFQRYCKSNPRKMARSWAEKEARNLSRLTASGLPAPKVLHLRQHILVMSFLGTQNGAFKRLHDVRELRHECAAALYAQAIELLRSMFLRCRLVHSDFSEFNLLVKPKHVLFETKNETCNALTPIHNDIGSPPQSTGSSLGQDDGHQLYIIDLAQAVEPDHPNASLFLRRDITTITHFFQGFFPSHQEATTENLYRYITGLDTTLRLGVDTSSYENQMRDDVFKKIPLPQALGEYTTPHCSEDVERYYNEFKALGRDHERIAYHNNVCGNKHIPPDHLLDEALALEINEAGKAREPPRGPHTNDRKHFDAENRNISFFELLGTSKEERKLHRKEIKMKNRERRANKVRKYFKKKGKRRPTLSTA